MKANTGLQNSEHLASQLQLVQALAKTQARAVTATASNVTKMMSLHGYSLDLAQVGSCQR